MIERVEYNTWDRDHSDRLSPRPPDPEYFEHGEDGEFFGYRKRTELGPRSWSLGPWLRIDHVKEMQKNEQEKNDA